MAVSPVVYTTAVLFRDLGFHSLPALQFDSAFPRHIDLKLFVKADSVLLKIMLHPKLSLRQRSVDNGNYVVLQNLSWPKARHGDVLLTIVGVNRRFTLNRSAQVLDGVI